ncbi:MAG TPA: patatin-like phospholipase family protein [Thermoanaerobaculia bacterium]|nr:patatin-like phospholipase family protein [Thermoanaerobaculia bacterium]
MSDGGVAPVPERAGGRVALVLSGGGARAAYQMGLLRYVGRVLPDFHFDVVCGTSAGAINAAFLAAHHGTMAEAAAALSQLWRTLSFENVFRVDVPSLGGSVARWGLRLLSGGSPATPRIKALLDTAPLRDLLSQVMTTVDDELIGVGENVRRGRLGALALTTLNYATGRTVTWVQGDHVKSWERPHRRSVAARLGVDHVMASCALPILFPAIRLGNSWYGDGGVRQSAPLAPAIHLGADRILAVSTRYPRNAQEAAQPAIHGYPPPAQILGAVLNAIFLDVVEQDALHLARINHLIERLPPRDRGALRPVSLRVLQPSQDLGRLASGFEREIPKAFRFLTRGLGTRETTSPDFLSLLMFHPGYMERLMAMGEADAEAARDELVDFLQPQRRAASAAS